MDEIEWRGVCSGAAEGEEVDGQLVQGSNESEIAIKYSERSNIAAMIKGGDYPPPYSSSGRSNSLEILICCLLV